MEPRQSACETRRSRRRIERDARRFETARFAKSRRRFELPVSASEHRDLRNETTSTIELIWISLSGRESNDRGRVEREIGESRADETRTFVNEDAPRVEPVRGFSRLNDDDTIATGSAVSVPCNGDSLPHEWNGVRRAESIRAF